LEISSEPDPFLHVFSSQEVLSFLNKFISSHLHVLIEKITSQHLLSIFVIDHVRAGEEETKSALCSELEVLVVEEYIIVVEENQL